MCGRRYHPYNSDFFSITQLEFPNLHQIVQLIPFNKHILTGITFLYQVALIQHLAVHQIIFDPRC